MWKAHFSVSGFLDCHQSKSASPSGKLHARIIRRSAPRARTFWHLIFRARAILPGDRKGSQATRSAFTSGSILPTSPFASSKMVPASLSRDRTTAS